ncbi:bifunctional glucokinase/RpiR family transcriptional regulator [uncultured Clostridium sp.]|uniref:MurR/RpiR family transcriptional regulator n=1 Tax=uncultured Clostridium sp. TaxID=59620 RepID=UPI000822A6E2|nr:MurR/RpiR family transcriptional regulator [uncultured Clostridium sp.]SCJ94657.1 bifunctional glucokinase/RpiR family transcriptional regulator [uncultured Clostridium sp.]
MGDLIYRLLLFLNDSREETLNYTIALTMIRNIREIPNMTINKLADMCYTSPAAISRFCRKLGYSSLSEFKKALSISINTNFDNSFSKLKGFKSKRSREEILNIMHDEICRELTLTKNSLDLKLIDRVIDLIYRSDHICIFGTLFSQLMCQQLQTNFARVGKLINIATDIQAQEKLASSLTPNSLAILISPTGRFIAYHERVWNNLLSTDCKIVTITENRDNAYKDGSDYIIYLAPSEYNNEYSPENQHSLMLLVEYLFIRYADLYNHY